MSNNIRTNKKKHCPINFTTELIRYKSVTYQDTSIISFLKEKLDKIGCKSDRLIFEGNGSKKVENLHSIYNQSESNNILYFAGHVDVVSENNKDLWKYPPFDGKVVDDILYGRGVVDMKAAIACFISAFSEFIEENKPNFGIGFLITGDEEADGINGTRKILSWMRENNKKISHCIVGEPTSENRVGDTIKVGRRGSINFKLNIIGKQGHVAYPLKAKNPIPIMVNLLKELKDFNLDKGNNFFIPSNLEITRIYSENLGENVIGRDISANFNIRFNDYHNSDSLIEWVNNICNKYCDNDYKFNLNYRVSGESFITKDENLIKMLQDSIFEETNIKANLSTGGGTSDARFIKNYASVIEIGLLNKTAHQINEHAKVSDILILKRIYKKFLLKYKNMIC